MLSNSEKDVAGHLYAEIARLKQQILEWNDEHRTELTTWTKKCGHLGNKIGRLRQLAAVNIDHQETLRSWTTQCGQLGNEIGRLRKEILTKEMEHQTELKQLKIKNAQLRLQLVDLKIDHRKPVLDNEIKHQTKCEGMNSDISPLLEKETEVDFDVKESVETTTDNLMKSLDSKLSDMNLENESLAEHTMECQQLNDETVIATIKPCDDSTIQLDSQYSLAQNTTNDVDEETKDSAYELNDTIEGCDQSLEESVSDQQVQENEETKSTSKRSIWNSLKKRVTPKRKHVQSSPH